MSYLSDHNEKEWRRMLKKAIANAKGSCALAEDEVIIAVDKALQPKPMPSDEEIAALVEEFMDDASLANENDFVYFAKEILKKWGNYELSRPEN